MASFASSSLNKQVREALKRCGKKFDVQKLIEEMDTNTSKALSNKDNIDYQQVKQSATSLLVTYEKFKNANSVSALEKMRAVIKGNENNGLADINILKEEQANCSLRLIKIRSIYQSAINFDIVLNAFLGGLNKQIIYVNNVDGKRQLFQLDYRNLPKFITANKKISISTTALTAEESYFTNITNSNMHKMDQVLARFEEKFRSNTVTYESKKTGKKYTQIKQNQVVGLGGGKKFRVLNIGDINEAYAAMSLSKQENFSLEYFFEEYLQHVNNAPSILGEDIQGIDAQYGVKSLNASAPSLNQFLKIALLIFNSPTPYSLQELKLLIKEQFNKPGQRNKYITDTVEAAIDIAWK